MPVTNHRTIQRWADGCAVTFNRYVRDNGLTHLTGRDGTTYAIPGSQFNALVTQQADERIAAGHAWPAMVYLPADQLTAI